MRSGISRATGAERLRQSTALGAGVYRVLNRHTDVVVRKVLAFCALRLGSRETSDFASCDSGWALIAGTNRNLDGCFAVLVHMCSDLLDGASHQFRLTLHDPMIAFVS